MITVNIKKSVFFLALFMYCQLSLAGQQNAFRDTLNYLNLVEQYDNICIGEYIHGSDNINREKFLLAQQITARGNHKIVIEMGMDEAVLFNRNHLAIDSVLSFFYPIYQDQTLRDFLIELRKTKTMLYGFDCQVFLPDVFLPELKEYFAEIKKHDQALNYRLNLPKSKFANTFQNASILRAKSFYTSLLDKLDKISFADDSIKDQIKVCLSNRISVCKTVEDTYFWDVRDDLMFECFNNLKSVFNKDEQHFVLLGASAHLCPIKLPANYVLQNPFGQNLNRVNTFFIHIIGYRGAVKTIRGELFSLDFVGNSNYKNLSERYPKGFKYDLQKRKNIEVYNIPFYKGVLTAEHGDFLINVGEIFPSK